MRHHAYARFMSFLLFITLEIEIKGPNHEDDLYI